MSKKTWNMPSVHRIPTGHRALSLQLPQKSLWYVYWAAQQPSAPRHSACMVTYTSCLKNARLIVALFLLVLSVKFLTSSSILCAPQVAQCATFILLKLFSKSNYNMSFLAGRLLIHSRDRDGVLKKRKRGRGWRNRVTLRNNISFRWHGTVWQDKAYTPFG